MSIFVLEALTPDGESVWPERFPTSDLMFKREEMGSLFFASQFMNRPIDFSSALLKREWLSTIYPSPRFMQYYVGVDPSISSKRTSDFFSMAVLASTQEKNFVLVDLVYRQTDPRSQVNAIIDCFLRYRPAVINIESNAAQALYFLLLEEEAKSRGIDMPPPRRSYSQVDKTTRIVSMSGVFQRQTVRLLGTPSGEPVLSLTPFAEEWSGFPSYPHDDALDAVHKAMEAAGISVSIPIADASSTTSNAPGSMVGPVPRPSRSWGLPPPRSLTGRANSLRRNE
jgi:predicted phage terminase large subunit-like protein